MSKQIKNKLIGATALLFMLANASTYGSTKDSFFLFGTVMGLIVSAFFFIIGDEE